MFSGGEFIESVDTTGLRMDILHQCFLFSKKYHNAR